MAARPRRAAKTTAEPAAPRSSAADPLAEYNRKRDFQKTAEPAGKHAPSGAGNIFIVQKHAATRLHWDFRIEVDGVLKSWAVTRGPSPDPADKRLAVRTEDHPLAYAEFEGLIARGEYGGGSVMLWDRGTWAPIPGKSAKDIDAGHLHFTLDGERMKGEWILIRLKPRPGEKRENWLLRKVADAFSQEGDRLVEHGLTSVLTGRSMAEIAGDEGAEVSLAGKKGKAFAAEMDAAAEHNAELSPPRGGEGDRVKRGEEASRRSATSRGAANRTAPSTSAARRSPSRPQGGQAPPAFQEPQLATLVDAVPTGNGWMHEIKFDGYRALIAASGDKVVVYTRNGHDWTEKFQPLVRALAALNLPPCLIDGEIVAYGADGNPDFSSLQNVLKRGHGSQTDSDKLTLHAFDLLSLDGEDLTGESNIERKERLERLLDDARPPIHVADHVIGAGEKLFAAMCAAGQEGIIAKRIDAPYIGKRTKNWVKVKCTNRQEFVVVGFARSTTKARPFGSLLLAQNEGGKLVYKGKVGTGFTAATLEQVAAELARVAADKAPVEVPRVEARGARWVEPKLVAEVAFAEFTGDGRVRHASFVGLRQDKPAKAVKPERAAKAPPAKAIAASPSASPVTISNRDRVIDPDSGRTKGELADYYAAIAPLLLQTAADRPLSLVRCPQGRAKKCFFQKHDSGGIGDHVRHVPVTDKDGGTEDYLWVDDATGLLQCVQMGTIEFHGWDSRAGNVELPDRMVFDLDPDEGLDFDDVRSAAVHIRDRLAEIGLTSFAMLSGGKGVHVVVPLTPGHDWDTHKDFSRRFAEALSAVEPERFVATMSKAKRVGRIFIDWLRNQRGATAVMPYSARSRANAPVALPIAWAELEDMADAHPFTILDVDALIGRAKTKALAGWGVAEQALPKL